MEKVSLKKDQLPPQSRKQIKDLLLNGGVIIYPTDTAYALGGVFDNKKVIAKILHLKKRRDKKFTLIASSIYQVQKFFPLQRIQRRAAQKFWPGPVSLVVSPQYAVRVPALAVARQLARLAGKPLIATSANIHKQKTPYRISETLTGADLVIDAGELAVVPPSAVIDIQKDGTVRVIREGLLRIAGKIEEDMIRNRGE